MTILSFSRVEINAAIVAFLLAETELGKFLALAGE